MAVKIIHENPLQMGMPSYYENKLNKTKIKNNIKMQFMRTMQSMTEYEGLPETMPKHLYERYLLEFGWCCVTEVEGNLYAFMGGLGGELNAYYLPTICVIANPFLNFNAELKIGEECIIAMNDSHMQGNGVFFDLYSQLMTENIVSMNLYDINLRTSNFLQAGDSSTAESAKTFYKKLIDGEMDIVTGTTLYESIKSIPYNNQKINTLSDMTKYHQYIMSLAYNYCGLDSNFNMKSEYVGEHETGLNHASLHAWIDDMMKFREENCKKINEMYGTNIKVKLSSGWKIDRILELEKAEENINTEEKLNEDEERNKLLEVINNE